MELFKSNKWQTLIALFFVLLYGCENNDPELLFNEVPSVRVQNKIDEVKTLLQDSENGWKVTYFTDTTQLGGYTFLFNFISDNEVKMDSDFGTPDPSKISLYDVTLGSTVKLSFTSKNVIHELSDGANFPNEDFRGQGYRGGFEFLFSSKDGEDLIFRVNRDRSNYLRFKKASLQDWTDISKNKDIITHLNNSSRHLGYQIAGKAYNFSYDENTRFSTSRENKDSLNFGVAYTPKGVTVSPPIVVNGIKYSEFTLDKSKNELVSLDGNFTIIIVSNPINVNLTWDILVDNTNVSSSFVTIFNQIIAANITRWTHTVGDRISIGTTTINGATTQGIRLTSIPLLTSGFFFARYNLSFGGILGEPSFLNISKAGGDFNWRFFPHFEPFVDFITNNAPYRTEPTPLVNPTEVKLISTKDPNVWFIIKR